MNTNNLEQVTDNAPELAQARTTLTNVAILESTMSVSTDPHVINGVSLVTRSGKHKSRYSATERLQILGATQADLNATIRLFCPNRPLYAATRGKSDDPRDWTTPRGRLLDTDVLRHLTGNLTPEIYPRWVAPHSWEATRWIGIDVDFRNDRDDFQRRCNYVIQALSNLGIPKEAILKSLTPSGGRHYRFFTTQKVRVSDIPQVMAMVGLHESSGQIEIFPKLNKGMRLPFGYIPDRMHDPRRWLRFIRAFRRGKFPRMNWLTCLQRASEHATTELNQLGKHVSVSSLSVVGPTSEIRSRRITRVNVLGIPKRQKSGQPTPTEGAKVRYKELLSRPFTNPSKATELWGMGICADGTRIEATKRLAWNLLFVRRLPLKEAENTLVEWVYETGSQTSADVRADQSGGTRHVEQQTRQLVQWMCDNHIAADAPVHDLSNYSVDELTAILVRLPVATSDVSLVSAALSFLRFAKLHGISQADGWVAQISVAGVIRRWPGCGGMKYKPLINELKACGLVEVIREKRQSSNGTGRPRTYLIRIPPELRTGATISHAEALRLAAQIGSTAQNSGLEALSGEGNMNTYMGNIPKTSSEEMRKKEEEAGQERTKSENTFTTLNPNSPDLHATKFNFRQAETARLLGRSTVDTTSIPTSLLTTTQSKSHTPLSSGPTGQMNTTVQIFQMRGGYGQRHSRHQQWNRPRHEIKSAQASTSVISLDRSIISVRGDSEQKLRRDSHEYAGNSS